MKCVKNVATGKVERISDEEASERVNSGQWRYVPKSAYKSQKRNG